jgi:hypothetical protein
MADIIGKYENYMAKNRTIFSSGDVKIRNHIGKGALHDNSI